MVEIDGNPPGANHHHRPAALLALPGLSSRLILSATRLRLPAWCRHCAVDEFLTIACPHCGENFPLEFDITEGSAEFVIDCEICCRPINVTVHVTDGEVDGVEATRS